MPEMSDQISLLLQSSGFWFGVVVFLLSQWGKFAEFSTDVPLSGAYPTTKITLRPRDLTGPGAYGLSLFAFLLVSFGVFLLACLVPPSILAGWQTIVKHPESGIADTLAMLVPDKAVPVWQRLSAWFSVDKPQLPANMDVYPLIVTAMLVGITQPIPGVDKVASFQKDIFHQWVGVPDRVLSTAISLSAKVLSEHNSDAERRAKVKELLGEKWITKIEDFADVAFYSAYVKRVELDKPEEVEAVEKGSNREQGFVIRDLILASCIASVRRSGGAALPLLAAKLGVEFPEIEKSRSSLFGGGLLIAFFVTIFLWIVLSLRISRDYVPLIAGVSNSSAWPNDPYTSAQYLVFNFLPFLLASVVVLMTISPDRAISVKQRPFFNILMDNWIAIMAIFFIVVFYDYVQAFIDRGIVNPPHSKGLSDFLSSRLHYYVGHAAIVTTFAAFLIVFVGRGGLMRKDMPFVRWALAFFGIVGVASLLSAFSRMQYQYAELNITPDFILLVVALNVVAAGLGSLMLVFGAREIAKR
jgi:hypothetical protein